MDDKCSYCKGSGYQSAAKNMPLDTPSLLMPVGVWPCPHCQGTGKGIDREKWLKFIKESEGMEFMAGGALADWKDKIDGR